MADRENITPEYLRQIISYDPETGEMTWLPRTPAMFGGNGPEQCAAWFNANMAGKPAGGVWGDKGYWHVTISGRKFTGARVAWAVFYGVWPNGDVDHINCVKTDNRIANLREVEVWQNNLNRPKTSSNTSGIKGVHFERAKGRYVAQVKLFGKYVYRRRFKTIDEAAAAYAEAVRQYHGEFARTA